MIQFNIFDSILLAKIQFQQLFNSKIIQFNSQALIDTGRFGKLPKKCPKSVQNRQKIGLFIKNGKYRFKI